MRCTPEWSPYSFSFNNPTNWTDKYGDCPDGSDCETVGSKAEKTANDLIKLNNGSTDFSNFKFSDDQKQLLFNEEGGLTGIGKRVNSIIKDQGYLNSRNKGVGDLFNNLVNNGELSNAELGELQELRHSAVLATKAQYLGAVFSPENLGAILALWSPAKLPVTKGSSILTKEVPLMRQAYVKAVGNLKGFGDALLKNGYSKEMVAKILHAQRRYLGNVYKGATPPTTLQKIYARNLLKYGDKLGPSVKWLRQQGKTWDEIIDSATRSGGKDLGF